jgi:hypothetical protein
LKSIIAGALCAGAIILCPTPHPASATSASADSTRAWANTKPALWVKAVDIFESNKRLVPGTVSQKIEELDDDGRVKSETDIDVTLALDEAGKIKSEIARATKDGKDITAEERKKAAEREKKEEKAAKERAAKREKDSDESSHSFSSDDGPLNAKMQSDVRVTELPVGETVDSVLCVRYQFSYPDKREGRSKGKPVMVTGTAWLEEGSGRPVKIEYTYDPLPKHVKKMRTVMRYGTHGDDAWVLREMTFEASGSFLFWGKSMRGEFAFNDYWKYEGPDSTE